MLLNVHFNNDYKIFEQLRCFAWLDTGKIVVSENSLDNDPRCLNSNYESLVSVVVETLGNFSSAVQTANSHGAGRQMYPVAHPGLAYNNSR